jgi:exosortase/archaeosortase family protein
MVAQARSGPGHDAALVRAVLPEWWPVLAGLLVLFAPTFHDLFTGAWIGEEQGHGPIIFGLSLWLIWRTWPATLAAAPSRPSWLGWPLLALGLVLHLLGRSQHFLMFEVSSIICVMAAVILAKRGLAAFRMLWFPFFFMLFMVPLPSELVAALTLPMKMAVSYVTEHLLFLAGYPIGRSGLQTLLTLEALGLFYLNVVRHTSAVRNVALALLIIPISFSANVVRVMTLTLVTYYFGDAAGQGFLHGFAGMVLFLTALVLILCVDSALQWAVRRKQAAPEGTR